MATGDVRWVRWTVGIAALCVATSGWAGTGDGFFFSSPLQGQVMLASSVRMSLRFPAGAKFETLRLNISDGNGEADQLVFAEGPDGGGIGGELRNLEGGRLVWSAEIEDASGQILRTEVAFETVALSNPDECEVLNAAECLLPYPSSRFLEAADTPTGYRVSFPSVGMPIQNDAHLSPEPYAELDGFSPTVQILMHFPGGVDLVRSAAPRLLDETRTHDLRSLDPDSPTVLIDVDTGERVLHFVELDARAEDPARQVLFMRPSRSLLPGHRYIVAVRGLLREDGSPVEPEAPFAALRDDQPTEIPAIESRRTAFADIFARLGQAGIERDDLLLAFDFVVQSDEGLTTQMLSMRDQAFDWLAGVIDGDEQTFSVDRVIENDCSLPTSFVWRQMEGTYQVPLFLTADPAADAASVGTLNVDSTGTPMQNGFTDSDYTIIVPCSVLTPLVGDCNGDFRVDVAELVTGVGIGLGRLLVSSCQAFDASEDGRVTVEEIVGGVGASIHGGAAPRAPAVLGHGLFMTGREFVPLVAAALGPLSRLQGLDPIDLIGGGTDWRGLSGRDIAFLGNIFLDLDNVAALPDRLRQGQLNALVLGRMMKGAVFNRHPAFQTPSGVGVFAGPEAEMYYYGISLGGIMGLMHAALSPDIEAFGIDEGSINFSFLLQRSTQALILDEALRASGITDPMQAALSLGLVHELWVRGESAGYATHITENPLPATQTKRILMTVAWLDPQVSNQGSEITARTLKLPNLVPGSLVSDLPDIPDQPGPLDSAYVVYDTGTFSLDNPGPFIPQLANLVPESNRCDPHGERRPTIPASLQQIGRFFEPDGTIENFCHDECDAGDAFEFPLGVAIPCDPFG